MVYIWSIREKNKARSIAVEQDEEKYKYKEPGALPLPVVLCGSCRAFAFQDPYRKYTKIRISVSTHTRRMSSSVSFHGLLSSPVEIFGMQMN